MTLVEAIRSGLDGAGEDVARRAWAQDIPRPWLGWLLLALMRHVSRQRWLVELVEARLSTVQTPRGEVPEMPGWTFEFRGPWFRLVGPGEALEVELTGEGGLGVDPHAFCARILGLAQPALPERLVRAALPSSELIGEALGELRAEGLLWHPRRALTFRLAEELEALCEEVHRLDFEAPDSQARWRAQLGEGDARSAVEWRQWLLTLLDAPASARAALAPLELVLGPQEFVAVCERLIDGPSTPAVGEAVARLDARGDLPPSQAVRRLASRLATGAPSPSLLCAVARYLLRRGLDREATVAAVLGLLPASEPREGCRSPFAGDVALLALEFVPEHAVALVRRALRSAIPSCRCAVGAALAGLDRPWCRRELLEALDAAQTLAAAAELVAASRLSGDEALRHAADRWLAERSPEATTPQREAQRFLDYASGWVASEVERRGPWLAQVGPRLGEALAGA